MSMHRRATALQAASEAAPNRSRFIAATNELARDGHVLEPRGMQVENFLRSGTILFDHDPKVPIATPVAAQINTAGDLEIEIEWPPVGVSADADKVRGLVKSGILRAGSVGFEPLDAEPLDAMKPRGGLHITASELLEFSIVCVGADTGAVVTQRSDTSSEDWKCGASQDLPIEDSDSWDGSAAEDSIFEWAGGKDFDPSKARKGFLAYNATKPKLRGSYKLPFASVTDGRLKASKAGIRAAASRLSSADISAECTKSAQAVIDHYEKEAGMAGKDDRGVKAKHTRALERAPQTLVFKRGLCEVAQLAHMLEQMGYAHHCAEWEADIEGDDSPVPGMLGDALVKFGQAFIAMADEEAKELLASRDLEIDDEDEIEVAERAYVAGGKTPRARAWRRGIAMARAGKTLSASNAQKLQDAQGHHERALKHGKALADHHEAVTGHAKDIAAANSKAGEAAHDVGVALAASKSEPEKAPEHIARALKAHKVVAAQHDAIDEARTNLMDRHQDAGDSNAAMGRSIKSAQRCVRSVVDGSGTGEDTDSKEVQTSDGTVEDTGADTRSLSVDFRRRQVDLLALTGA